MKVGIVSDTHDSIDLAARAVDFFEEKNCGVVLHCGDMVAPFTAQLFDADFEFHAVRGNNDGEWNLKQVVEDFGHFYNNVAEIVLDDLEICLYHGTEEEIVQGLVSNDYDFVFRGHTHSKKIAEHSGTVEVNPGGIKLPEQEEEFHVAILDTGTREIELHRIEK